MQKALVVLDALAKPAPGADGERDSRSAAQRRHDGFEDACCRLLRDGGLPDTGGVPATVVITMPDDAWRTGRGTATTGHGAVLTAAEGIALAGSDCQLFAVVLNSLREITAYGDTQRLFTRKQRLALTARDGGCSFPGCTVPAAWTEAHHVIPFQNGGPTTVANGTLLCGHHHRSFEKAGWACEIRAGTPHWIPPTWLDRDRRARTNEAAHLDVRFAADVMLT